MTGGRLRISESCAALFLLRSTQRDGRALVILFFQKKKKKYRGILGIYAIHIRIPPADVGALLGLGGHTCSPYLGDKPH